MNFDKILDEVKVKNKSRIDTWFIKRSDCLEALSAAMREIDNELAFIEDIAHGEIGMKITELRKKLNE